MKYLPIIAFLGLSACQDTFTGQVLKAGAAQPAASATTWQAEMPHLTQQCLSYVRSGAIPATAMANAGYTAKRNPFGDLFFQKMITKKSMFGEFYNVSFETDGPTGDYDGRLSCFISWADHRQALASFQAELTRALQGQGYQMTNRGTDRFGYDIMTFTSSGGAVDVLSNKLSADYGPSAYILRK